MKIICTQENLRGALQSTSRIIANSNTLPILNNVLLKTENGQLKISSTNLEVAISTTTRCKIEEEGIACVGAKTLASLVNILSPGNVVVETKGQDVIISTTNSRNRLKAFSSEEFPIIPQIEKGAAISLDPKIFKQALDEVLFAVSASETQPELAGVLLAPSGSAIKLVATDRYRLAEKKLSVAANLTNSVVIPQRAALELSRILSSQPEILELVIADNQMAARAGATLLISRLVDAQFPDYQQIIPQEFNTTIKTSRAELATALKTSGIFAHSTGSVNLSFSPGQSLNITATSNDTGESTVRVAGEVDGAEGTVILNYRYVLEALNVMTGETVLIKIVNESAPVVFAPEGQTDYIYLVMPIKS